MLAVASILGLLSTISFPAGAGHVAAASPPGSAAQTVTLITGDRVMLAAGGSSVRIVPAVGRERIRFLQHRQHGDVSVVPADALRMLGDGTLDARLFNVTALARAGYTDAKRADIPLIVSYQEGAAGRTDRSRMSTAPARVTRELPHLAAQAISADKDSVASFWTAVTEGDTTTRDARAGTRKIWLDGRRRLTLDHSVPQIGTPSAWRAGYTGVGVAVAVVDSGIDTRHPDLAGKVVAARNFTDDPDPADKIGHGTHVASTIAGTAAASGGQYRGVAPDAKLLNAKVCPDRFCDDSAILAGMDWAAADQRARIVNLSLGDQDLPGVDPLEEAVDRLSDDYGTLFVVGAGNSGTVQPVSSPATADAALAVGAVDQQDALAEFSSRGPRTGDGAIKPDITAPGVDITAAKAGGSQADGYYTQLSGTSMATPHVAGAAALLAQQHKDWTGGMLKSALMGSAAPNPALGLFEQGAGRVDIGRATRQTLTAAPASLSLGTALWPHDDDRPSTTPVTYHNTAGRPVTLHLNLAVTGPTANPAPDGMFTVSDPTVTVPGGGSATVTVTADTRIGEDDGWYTGRLSATDQATETTLDTPLAIQREVESYRLSIRHIDRDGAPASSTDTFVIGADAQPTGVPDADGIATLRLPAGRYSVVSGIVSGSGQEDPTVTVLGAPRVELEGDQTLTLDARTARPVRVTRPRPSARLTGGLVFAGTPRLILLAPTYAGDYGGIFMGSTGPAADPADFTSGVWGEWAQPGADGDTTSTPYVYHLAWFGAGRVLDGLDRRPRDSELAVVHATYPSPPGRAGEEVTFAAPAGTGTPAITTAATVFSMPLPATRSHFYTTDGVRWRTELVQMQDVDGEQRVETRQGASWRTYERGTRTENWGAGVFGPSLPTPTSQEGWVRQFPGTLVAAVPMFAAGLPAHYGHVAVDSARTTLTRDGQQVATSSEPGYIAYDAPSADAWYQLDTELTQHIRDTSTRITATWRFRSHKVVSGGDLLPLLAVRFQPHLDHANRAPAGAPLRIPVTVQRQPGAPESRLRSLTIQASSDDGHTWRPVPVIRTTSGWIATVTSPRAGHVSLRARAVDSAGNAVDQTIIRAFAIGR